VLGPPRRYGSVGKSTHGVGGTTTSGRQAWPSRGFTTERRVGPIADGDADEQEISSSTYCSVTAAPVSIAPRAAPSARVRTSGASGETVPQRHRDPTPRPGPAACLNPCPVFPSRGDFNRSGDSTMAKPAPSRKPASKPAPASSPRTPAKPAPTSAPTRPAKRSGRPRGR
jgi:hypothetical protein